MRESCQVWLGSRWAHELFYHFYDILCFRWRDHNKDLS